MYREIAGILVFKGYKGIFEIIRRELLLAFVVRGDVFPGSRYAAGQGLLAVRAERFERVDLGLLLKRDEWSNEP